MIVDVHTHFFRAESDWQPQVSEDARRCGLDLAGRSLRQVYDQYGVL